MCPTRQGGQRDGAGHHAASRTGQRPNGIASVTVIAVLPTDLQRTHRVDRRCGAASHRFHQ